MTRVLLVEDNAGDARLVRELLREASSTYAVSHAVTLADALPLLDQHDVVLLDLTLPDACGIVTVQRLAASARQIPIVVLTGNADERVAIEALSAGAQDYLRKDEMAATLLVKAMRYAIERKRLATLEIEQQQLEERSARARLIAEVTTAATSSLEIAPCMRAVAQVLVPQLADGCAIDLVAGGRVASAGELAGEQLTVSLNARDKPLGALVLAAARGFGERERLLAFEVSSRIALGIDNAALYADAQRAIRARDEMMAIVSHDLRNPLGVVDLCLDILRHDPDALPTALPRATRAVEQMGVLINDLLQISQIDAGTLVIEPTRVELAPFLEDLFDHHRVLAGHKKIRVTREVSPSIGAIEVDPHRLTQALGNLLGNAIKFTPQDGEVVLGAQRAADDVVISVRDTGPGIPADQVPRIFDRFWQADRQRTAGVGLGLPIAKGIIERHGGRIDVASELGRGTTFRITLPRSADRTA